MIKLKVLTFVVAMFAAGILAITLLGAGPGAGTDGVAEAAGPPAVSGEMRVESIHYDGGPNSSNVGHLHCLPEDLRHIAGEIREHRGHQDLVQIRPVHASVCP